MTQLFRDGARGELQTAINSSATTLSVSNGELFSIATVGTGALSSGDWFKAVLQSGAQFEIVYVRSHETVSLPDTFTNVLRGQDGTTAQAFPVGTVFGIRPTAGDMDKAINQREPSQAAGSAGHYWDGTKTWKPLNSAAVGLSLVNNTSDEDKPVSTAQQQALDTKVTSVAGKGLSTEDYSTAEKNKLADVAANATANSTDAALRDRTTHTGSQAISTVTGLQTALNGAAPVNATLTDAAASSTLPATTSTALTALLQTVRNCLKWLVANTVQISGAQTIAGVKTFSSRSSHAGAYTPSLTPAHSATPTFDCAASNSFEPGVMTSNVTSLTMSNPVAGQTVQIILKQDATGGRTHAVPSGAKIDGSINTGANRVSILVMTYYGAGSMWVGNWLQVPA